MQSMRSSDARWSAVIRAAVLMCGMAVTVGAGADSCMVSPTQKEIVSGRFGKFRNGGVENHGSSNQTPHMHDGLDFSTSNANQPLFATTEGVVTWVGVRGSAGNTVMIKRPSGDIVAYYHLSGFDPAMKVGAQVQPGQVVGISGNTNRGNETTGNMAKHLHFVYGASNSVAARVKAFTANAGQGPFNPAQLPSVFNQQSGIGWKTDPSPYFCKTYPIVDGNPAQAGILGSDTKQQHAILFGSVPNGGTPPNLHFESSQVSAGNADAVIANSRGSSVEAMIKDTEGYGALPSAPLGGYETMSASEMMFTESTRRFTDAKWANELPKLSLRALWIDYDRAIGVGNYLDEAIYRKKERVEALLAIYTSQKIGNARNSVKNAHAVATKNAVVNAIK